MSCRTTRCAPGGGLGRRHQCRLHPLDGDPDGGVRAAEVGTGSFVHSDRRQRWGHRVLLVQQWPDSGQGPSATIGGSDRNSPGETHRRWVNLYPAGRWMCRETGCAVGPPGAGVLSKHQVSRRGGRTRDHQGLRGPASAETGGCFGVVGEVRPRPWHGQLGGQARPRASALESSPCSSAPPQPPPGSSTPRRTWPRRRTDQYRGGAGRAACPRRFAAARCARSRRLARPPTRWTVRQRCRGHACFVPVSGGRGSVDLAAEWSAAEGGGVEDGFGDDEGGDGEDEVGEPAAEPVGVDPVAEPGGGQ